MASQYKIGLSKQAIGVYTLLLTHGNLSSADIGKRLHIAPTGVYRLLDHLAALGIITASVTRPTRYSAKDPHTARECYLLAQRMWFDASIRVSGDDIRNRTSSDGGIQVSFLSDRIAVFDEIARDFPQVKRSASMIVLGLPDGIAPELLKAQHDAVARGVVCRIIVQEYTKANAETIRHWIQNGAEVRIGTSIGFHIIVLDDTVAYVMASDPKDRSKRTCVRFGHQGITREMQRVFDRHWQHARPVSTVKG